MKNKVFTEKTGDFEILFEKSGDNIKIINVIEDISEKVVI
ncbi:Uncharacterised protein [Sebaldella termitidis]|uniref:Uncharacterized protein n=1 Tax=Sebaldella termitidis (strain ATCC 33386 / NCTC 11300) TaxID=526218 RepID=D1AGM7_SEBTE|nr:hypothetical protein Sterm_3914 [Sebaldella termitidis ATCC 33386]SUI26090.1 Uncharacterised protein [Sebaldella termitidis]